MQESWETDETGKRAIKAGSDSLSRKNHRVVDGRLLQIDKKYSHLKLKQKEKIYAWMFEETKRYHDRNGKCPEKEGEDTIIIDAVYDRIEQAGIWVPYGEVLKHYQSIKTRICRRIRQGADAGGKIQNRHPNQRVNFMNMCMISDGQGNVVMLEKVNDRYHGATFPGGHVERQETFLESMIREVREETGLVIENPKFCGIYHWFIDSVHQIVSIYHAERYRGELCSSEEGQVSWISEKEFLKKDLAPGMENVIKLIHDDTLSECYVWNEEGSWKERLL